MEKLKTPAGVTVSYDRYGEGPPLVLIHGGFSDHVTNWEFVKPLLEKHFTVYAIARRGRGETDATEGHGIPDEAEDAAAVIRSIGEPVFLLGHSYGGQCALNAAAIVPERVRKLVLYEPPRPDFSNRQVVSKLEQLASAGEWDQMCVTFFVEGLTIPAEEIEELRTTELWPPIVDDAKASLQDIRAVVGFDFDPERYRHIACPVLFQVGTESPRDLYITDMIVNDLPNATIRELPGQAHEGMTTAPEMYAEQVIDFFLGSPTAEGGEDQQVPTAQR